MIGQLKLRLFSTLLALTLALATTGVVFADGELPPAPETQTVEEPPVGVEEEAPPVAAVPDANLPEGEKDPIWCPTGVAPKPGISGCSPSFPNLSSLVAGGTPGGNGTIWIEGGNDSGSEVVIDGAGNWTSAANYNLTLQGGWSGVSGSKVINGVSTFDTAISIVNWNGAVAINNIMMNSAENASFPITGALFVQTTKNIALSNVSAMSTNHSSSSGIYLTNTASSTQATITLKNVTLSANTTNFGLSAWSDGAITLTNVTADGNKGGVYLDNSIDLLPSTVTVNTSSFDNSNGSGLSIFSNGAIKLNQVQANGNNGSGVYADNTYASGAQPVTAIGFLNAINNNGAGLRVFSDGAVTLTNLNVSLNGFNSSNGAYIDNSTSLKPQPVTLTGTNLFNYNGLVGLAILSNGAVLLNNVTASYNGWAGDASGVYIDNATSIAKSQPVTLNGTNSFVENGFDGLSVFSYGAITVSNVTAINNGEYTNDNTGSGVALYNSATSTPKGITLKGVNLFINNDESGLLIISKGAIMTSNVTAQGNGEFGAYLENSAGVKPGVTLTGVNAFNQNISDGLGILSTGAITVSNVTAMSNQGYGLFLVNNFGFQSPVNILGYGSFIGNSDGGLYITSKGAVTTKNLTVNKNYGHGVEIFTAGITAPQKVTLSGSNTFYYNGSSGSDSGLVVNADGAITLSNVRAEYNFFSGAVLDNYTNWINHPYAASAFATYGSISLTGYGVFVGNMNSDGLNISSKGNASLSNISANSNGNGVGVEMNVYGKVTLMCVTTTHNFIGLKMNVTTPLLTIKGLFAAGNASNNEMLSYVTLSRAHCP